MRGSQNGTHPSRETDLYPQIEDYLKYRGIFAWRNNTGRRGRVSFGYKGSSDFLGIYRGLFLAIEAKRIDGKLRPEQVIFLERIRRDGGIAIEARSVEDVREGLLQADARLRAHEKLQ